MSQRLNRTKRRDDAPLVLLDRLTNELGGLGLTLSANDDALLLLYRLVDEVDGPLRILLGDLLGLDGVGESGGEGDVGEGDVVKDDVEAGCATTQILADQTRDHLSLLRERQLRRRTQMQRERTVIS